jgi:hypothetical protein
MLNVEKKLTSNLSDLNWNEALVYAFSSLRIYEKEMRVFGNILMPLCTDLYWFNRRVLFLEFHASSRGANFWDTDLKYAIADVFQSYIQ